MTVFDCQLLNVHTFGVQSADLKGQSASLMYMYDAKKLCQHVNMVWAVSTSLNVQAFTTLEVI